MEACEVVTALFYPNVVGITSVSKELTGFGRRNSSAGVKFVMCMSPRGGVGDGACGRVRTRQSALSMSVILLILFPEKLVPILCQILETGPFPLLTLSVVLFHFLRVLDQPAPRVIKKGSVKALNETIMFC